ncbi:MAG: DUF167 domain-containing protein [Limisphaerales bacterium]
MPPWLTPKTDHVLLAVRVQPRASANSVQGELGNHLRIRITAPPVDSKANDALIEFLSKLLHCSRSQIQIKNGLTSRQKTLAIYHLPPDFILQTLQPYPPPTANRPLPQ